MVQCEMCGAETADPNRVKIEGAELDVCDDCTEFGTEVRTQESSSTSTKYSTSSSSSSSSSTSSSSSSSSSGGSRSRRDDVYDDLEELAPDYGDRIRQGREAAGLSQEELAKQLNEKASFIRKLEHGDTLPSDDLQRSLERALEIDLSVTGGDDDADWSGGSSTGNYTLGDMVERKD
jgi:putative transcription factor